jgi:multimeric flavodoxin WrbA
MPAKDGGTASDGYRIGRRALRDNAANRSALDGWWLFQPYGLPWRKTIMQTVSLLGICASPRKRGNSWYLLERAFAGAAGWVERDRFSFSGKKISPCVSCFRCEELGDCAVKDDFQELRDAWMAADAIIYSVPVYHMGVPGQLKCFLDRLGNTLCVKEGDGVSKLLKVIGVIAQGDCLFSGQEQVMTALINHAVLMGCIPVAGDPWQSYLGAAGWTRQELGENSLQRLYEGEEADAKVAVAAAESLGKRVTEMAMIVKAGGIACREMLAADVYGSFLSRIESGDPPSA